MSQEREEVTVTTEPPKVPQYAKSEIDPELTRQQLKARLVTILERGMVHDRMSVPLPDDVHGEWARNDPIEIARLQTLGFQVDYEYAPKRALHGDGTGAAIIGDVIFMTCPKYVKEIIDEIRHEQFLRINAPSKSKEDEELIANTFRDTQQHISAFSESKTYTADEAAIRETVRETLRRVDAQTQPAPV